MRPTFYSKKTFILHRYYMSAVVDFLAYNYVFLSNEPFEFVYFIVGRLEKLRLMLILMLIKGKAFGDIYIEHMAYNVGALHYTSKM